MAEPPPPPTDEEFLKNYGAERDSWVRFASSVARLASELPGVAGVGPHAVTWRAKEVDSLRQKLIDKRHKLKGYKDPETEVTDRAGVRIVVYLESEIDLVVTVLRRNFQVDEVHSVDKRAELGEDQFGYRSVHLICILNAARNKLPEYSAFATRPVEIQIRTLLEHAWSEIEHQRNYKFGGALPREIKRKLFRAAAALEEVDQRFSEIAAAVTAHVDASKEDPARSGLTTPIVRDTVDAALARVGHAGLPMPAGTAREWEALTRDLGSFGVSSREQLDALFTDDWAKAVQSMAMYSIPTILTATAMA